jgi:hypothetical protein
VKFQALSVTSLLPRDFQTGRPDWDKEMQWASTQPARFMVRKNANADFVPAQEARREFTALTAPGKN